MNTEILNNLIEQEKAELIHLTKDMNDFAIFGTKTNGGLFKLIVKNGHYIDSKNTSLTRVNFNTQRENWLRSVGIKDDKEFIIYENREKIIELSIQIFELRHMCKVRYYYVPAYIMNIY